MKMFKKLMAVALAGVMALAVLTGCASTVNKKEYINILNDMAKSDGITVEQDSDALAKQVLTKVSVYAEDHNKGVYRTMDQTALNALYDIASEDVADIKSIVPKDSKDQYSLMWTTVEDYQSKDFQNYKEFIRVAMSHETELNDVEEDTLGKTATASIATQKIGDTTFLVIVLVQAAK